MAPSFVPPWWAAGPHVQTVLARLLRSNREPPLVRERLETPDGDFLDLDWTAAPPDWPLVVLMHGLEGSARSKYALELYRQLTERGMAAVGINFRSCSGEINRAARLYHSGETSDPRFVFDTVRARFPDRWIGAIGVSLGGNVLLKYLAEEAEKESKGEREKGRKGEVSAAAVVSVPYDLAAGAEFMERGFAQLYVRNLLRKLGRKVRAKAAMLRDRIDVAAALRATTFRAFDDAATAPLHGFADADDYYTRSSSGPLLARIAVPTRLIHALDDPFLPASAVPLSAMHANPAFDPLIVPHGGHVGFLTAGRTFWAEHQAVDFIASRCTVHGAQYTGTP